MKNQMLKYYMHDGPSAFRFELAGNLNDEGAARLDQDWRTASSAVGDRTLIVDMTFVTNVDERGRALLGRWHAEGAQLVCNSNFSRELAESITGKSLADLGPASDAFVDRTWLPFLTSFAMPVLLAVLLVGALLFPVQVHAANLKAQTIAAWDGYIESVNVSLQDRVRQADRFLWIYESPERVEKVRGGETVVAPAPGPNPRQVPGGLIHHWIAAAFLPGTRIEDVLKVTQDYDRYKEFYRPSVIESKALARTTSDDRFSMLLMNKTLFLKTALRADYQTINVRLDDRRFYSLSRSTRIQEIEDYGQASEHRLPEGEGGGYIWKLFSIARMEQRDGGVYVEMEAVALSREIPAPARLIVDPIVRRVSRNALLTSIKQTEQAVRLIALTESSPAHSPASAEQMPRTSTEPYNKTSAFVRVH